MSRNSQQDDLGTASRAGGIDFDAIRATYGEAQYQRGMDQLLADVREGAISDVIKDLTTANAEQKRQDQARIRRQLLDLSTDTLHKIAGMNGGETGERFDTGAM